MRREMICICCPRGCRLVAERENDNAEWEISGNQCPRGAAYAIQEITNPCRVVTAVVKTNSSQIMFLPVRTDKPYPREGIAQLLNTLYGMTVNVPVKRGDVLIHNVNGTDIDVIASESIEE